MNRKVLLSIVLGMTLGGVQAQEKTDCAINYTRKACAGKDAESFKKCDGKASCMTYAPAATLQTCQDAALKACANDRLDVTKSKVITASFKSAPLKSASGKEDFCQDYSKRKAEFDRCPEDPK